MINIRPEQPDDISIIYEINKAAKSVLDKKQADLKRQYGRRYSEYKDRGGSKN